MRDKRGESRDYIFKVLIALVVILVIGLPAWMILGDEGRSFDNLIPDFLKGDVVDASGIKYVRYNSIDGTFELWNNGWGVIKKYPVRLRDVEYTADEFVKVRDFYTDDILDNNEDFLFGNQLVLPKGGDYRDGVWGELDSDKREGVNDIGLHLVDIIDRFEDGNGKSEGDYIFNIYGGEFSSYTRKLGRIIFKPVDKRVFYYDNDDEIDVVNFGGRIKRYLGETFENVLDDEVVVLKDKKYCIDLMDEIYWVIDLSSPVLKNSECEGYGIE